MDFLKKDNIISYFVLSIYLFVFLCIVIINVVYYVYLSHFEQVEIVTYGFHKERKREIERDREREREGERQREHTI